MINKIFTGIFSIILLLECAKNGRFIFLCLETMEIRIHCRTAFSFMNRNRFRYIVHLQMHLRFNANIIILLELIFPRYSTHSTKFWKGEVKRVLLNIGMNSRLNDFLLPIRTFKGDLISISKKSPLISRPNTRYLAPLLLPRSFFFCYPNAERKRFLFVETIELLQSYSRVLL